MHHTNNKHLNLFIFILTNCYHYHYYKTGLSYIKYTNEEMLLFFLYIILFFFFILFILMLLLNIDFIQTISLNANDIALCMTFFCSSFLIQYTWIRRRRKIIKIISTLNVYIKIYGVVRKNGRGHLSIPFNRNWQVQCLCACVCVFVVLNISHGLLGIRDCR